MADRVVSYDFRANMTGLLAGMTAGGKAVQGLATQLTVLDAKGAKARAGLATLGRGAGVVALGAAAGLAAIVTVTTNFDKAMSKVAATGEDARASLDDLRQAAIDAGAATAFSASEAAAGIENLLKAGVSAQDVLAGGLSGALDLAAAGELEVADAAEIAATAMTQFKLGGQDVGHIADLLAAGAGKAQGEVSDLAMALKQSGLVASQMGVSIEETTGTLAAFASAGLLGSDAGTSFRTMLLRLANPTQESAALMEELGINAYDAQGNFVGMASVAEQLKVAFEGKTQAERDSALATIFGSDAIRAASVLYDQAAAGVNQWTANVNDAGFAAETAATKLDNLAGDLEALKGSLETALIGAGEGGMAPLRLLVQSITEVVNAFNELPGPAKTGVTATLALTAALAGTVFISSKVVSGLASARIAMMAMGASATQAARTTTIMSRAMGAAAGLSTFALGTQVANRGIRTLMTTAGLAAAGFSVGGPWGAGIGAAIGLLVGLGTSSESTAGQVDEFTAALDAQTGALTENNRELAKKSLQESGAFDDAQKLGLNLATVTDAALGNADAIAKVNAALSEYAFQQERVTGSKGGGQVVYDEQAQAASRVADAISKVNGIVGESSKEWEQNAEAAGGATDATGGFSAAADDSVDSSKDAAKAVNELAQAMRAEATAAGEAFDATTSWGAAVIAARQQIKTGEKGIDALTEAGQNNRAALAGLRDAWNSQPAAVKNSQKAYNNARQTFIQVAESMGVGSQKARQLANDMLEVPRRVLTEARVETGQAFAAIGQVSRLLGGLDGRVATTTIRTVLQTVGDKIGFDADGGSIPKDGGPYADRYPYMLAPGEEVVSNRHGQADRHRGLLKAINAGLLADGGTAGFDYRNTYVRGLANGGTGDSSTGPELFNNLRDNDARRRATSGVVDILQRERHERLQELRHQVRDADKFAELRKKERDAAKSLVDSIRDSARSLSDSIVSQFSGADLFGAEGASFSSILSGLGAAEGQGTLFAQLVQRLKALGLDGGALQALLETGNVGLLQDFAGQSAADLQAFENQFNATSGTAQLSGQIAAWAVFNERQAAANEKLDIQSDLLREANKDRRQLEKRVEHMEKVLEKASAETGPKNFAKALNDKGAAAARRNS